MIAKYPYITSQLPRMIDISNVKTNSTLAEIDLSLEAALKYRFKCVFAMPLFTPVVVKKLRGSTSENKDILVGGTTGFPSGEDTTATKVAAAKELVAMGCDEIDMVVAVGALKSGKWDMYKDDIKAVRDAIGDLPLKTILEVSLLTPDEIKRASVLAVEAGSNYVKTGTGWMNKPATVEDVRLIHSAIGDSAFIKAAGGVSTLEQVNEMIEAGCSRFGISYAKTMSLMKQLEEYLSQQ